jgi:transposase InsO family protein
MAMMPVTSMIGRSKPARMGAVGNCYDNIYAERVIGILKGEYSLDLPFVNLDQVTSVVKEAVGLYNTDRPHLSLGMVTPQDVYHGLVIDVPAIDIPAVVHGSPIT